MGELALGLLTGVFLLLWISTLPASGAAARPKGDLAITKASDKDKADVDDKVTFTLTARNNGPSGAFEAFVVDTLPPELEFVSVTLDTPVTGDGCTHAAGVVTCNLGALPPLEPEDEPIGIEVVTRVRPDASGCVTNEASIENREVLSPPWKELKKFNNSAEASVSLPGCDPPPPPSPAALAGSLIDEGVDGVLEPVDIGLGPRQFHYLFLVVNSGGTDGTVGVVEFAPPDEVVAIGCVDTRQISPVACAGGDVPAGGRLEVRLLVQMRQAVTRPDTVVADAQVQGAVCPGLLCDVEATPLNGGAMQPGLIGARLTATAARQAISLGETTTVRLRLENDSAFPATGIVVRITVPSGLTQSAGPGTSWRIASLPGGTAQEAVLSLRGGVAGGYRVVAEVAGLNEEVGDFGPEEGIDPERASVDIAVSERVSPDLVAPSGVIFDDRDGDGVIDAGEPGIRGIKVELVRPTGETAASTTTSSSGRFRFHPVAPGHSVRVPGDGLVVTGPQTHLVQAGSLNFGVLAQEEIPATGIDATGWLAIALGSLALGGALTQPSRRRWARVGG